MVESFWFTISVWVMLLYMSLPNFIKIGRLVTKLLLLAMFWGQILHCETVPTRLDKFLVFPSLVHQNGLIFSVPLYYDKHILRHKIISVYLSCRKEFLIPVVGIFKKKMFICQIHSTNSNSAVLFLIVAL